MGCSAESPGVGPGNDEPVGSVAQRITRPYSNGESGYGVPSPKGIARDIAAVGIAADTHHVYTWYLDSTYSQGTTNDLEAYHTGTLPFTNNTGFSMSQLIDVDDADNLLWYYYWRDGSNRIWRTTGTSATSGTADKAQLLSGDVINPSTLWGISFIQWDADPQYEIESWYGDGLSGTEDISNHSMKLNE